MDSEILIKDFDEIINHSEHLEKLTNKNFLIAGANGFFGSYIINFLLHLNKVNNSNITIHALVRNKNNLHLLLEKNKKNKNLMIYQNNIAKSKPKISANIDYVFHLASKASPEEYINNPLDIIESNIFGTFNLANLAIEKNCTKFIYFSTGEVYGAPISKNQEFSEDNFGVVNPFQFRSSNTESKRMSENIILAISKKENLKFNIIRPFHTYGPGMSLDTGLIHNELLSNILSNKNLTLKSNGLAKRNFCYISDFLNGFLKVLIIGEHNTPYNIANPYEEISIKLLAKKLLLLSKKKNLKIVYKFDNKNTKRDNNIIRSKPSINKLKKLNWEPIISLDEGLKRTLKYYEEINIKDFKRK